MNRLIDKPLLSYLECEIEMNKDVKPTSSEPEEAMNALKSENGMMDVTEQVVVYRFDEAESVAELKLTVENVESVTFKLGDTTMVSIV